MNGQIRANELEVGKFFTSSMGGTVWKVVQTSPVIKAVVWCNHKNHSSTVTLQPDDVVILLTDDDAEEHIEHDGYRQPKALAIVRVEIYLKKGSDIIDGSTFMRLDYRITSATPGDDTAAHAYAYVVVIQAARDAIDEVIDLIKALDDVANVVKAEAAS